MDFDPFNGSISLLFGIRNCFAFRELAVTEDRAPWRGYQYYPLRALSMGARRTARGGQAVASQIINVYKSVTIHTRIRNILIAARGGQSQDFARTVRAAVCRIRQANLLTSSGFESHAMASGDEFLASPLASNRSILEEYGWIDGEGSVHNSTKTTAKIHLALQEVQFTYRTFASAISSIMRAVHTTRINPVCAFGLFQAHLGAFRRICCDCNWDDIVNYVDSKVFRAWRRLAPSSWKETSCQ